MEEEIVIDLCEVDVGFILGWGFVFYIGGVLFYIDIYGVVVFVKCVDELKVVYGDQFEVLVLLCEMVEKGEIFYGCFVLAEVVVVE